MSSDFAVIGHRGWPTRFPDNSLAGLMAAAAVADGVEVDVRRSADGKLVLSHDPTIGGLLVSEHPWSVLGEVDLGGGHRPALLDEALATLPDVRVMLEVKNMPGEPGFEPDHRLALETAARARPGDMLTSFFWPTVDAVHRRFPEISTGPIVDSGANLVEAITHAQDRGHRVLSVHRSLLLAEGADVLVHGSGLEVYVWTVNDGALAEELVARGATGIITDDPGLIALAREGR